MRRSALWQTLIIKLTLWSLIIFSFNVFIPRNQVLLIYDSKRLVVCLLIMLFAVGLLCSARLRQSVIALYRSLEQPTRTFAFGFIVWSLIATLLSDYRISALTHWFYLVGLFLLLSVFFDYFRVARANLMGLALLLNGLLFFSVASAFWLLLYHHEAVSNSTFFGFANPRFINQVHVWLVLPMAYLAVRARRRNRRALLPLISVAMAFSIGFTLNGRGVTLALIAGFILMALVDRALWRQWLATLLISGGLGALISFALFNPLPSYLLGIDSDAVAIRTTSSGRLILWSQSVEFASFWGQGGGAFACQPFANGRPHNSVLNVLVHWGWGGVLCYVSLCLLLLYKVAISRSRITQVLGASVLTGLLYSLVSGVLDSPMSQLLAIMSLAAFWASLNPLRRSEVGSYRVGLVSHAVVWMLALGAIMACGYRIYERVSHYPQQFDEIVDVRALGMKTQFWVGHNCLEKPEMP